MPRARKVVFRDEGGGGIPLRALEARDALAPKVLHATFGPILDWVLQRFTEGDVGGL